MTRRANDPFILGKSLLVDRGVSCFSILLNQVLPQHRLELIQLFTQRTAFYGVVIVMCSCDHVVYLC